MKFRFPPFLIFLIKVYFFNIFLFFLCRLLLYLLALNAWQSDSVLNRNDILHSFLIGIRFDSVVISYILAIPFLVLSISYILRKEKRSTQKISVNFLAVSLGICLIIQISNIPYFLHFFSPLSTGAFLWLDDPIYSIKMIMQEKSFFIYLFPLVLLLFLEYLFLKKQSLIMIRKTFNADNKIPDRTALSISIFICCLALLFIGIRGRLTGKTPIQAGTAYFSDNALLNNLGLNPVFTLMRSYIDDRNPLNAKIKLMDEEEALQLAGPFLSIPESEKIIGYPFARKVIPSGDKDKANVVIVIMEAMSKYKLGKWGGPKNLTPNLNMLIRSSLYFDQIYTSGIHTFNGIYSTLFSFPALYKQQPMKLLIDEAHDGLANILRKENYQTCFFTTHDPEFDNVQGFLLANGFDRIYSQFDYPSEWIQSTNGVADHKMFEYSIKQLNTLAKNGKPFLSVFMTTSDHGPYIIPKGIDFNPHSSDIKDQIVEYADWSIGNFLNDARKTSWFNNTIFVFIGDHGISLGHTYDMPLSFHETPLIFYAPEKFKEAKTFYEPGGQIDVAPTLLGLLQIPYVNNTPGIDLIKEQRPFIYFSADDRLGCMDKEHYLILRKTGKETLYRYKDLNTTNYLEVYPTKVDSMKKYMFSMLQCSQWMINKHRMKYLSRQAKNITHINEN